jgi:hypothetical protein
MPLVLESRRRSPATLSRRWPDGTVVDVTSKGEEPWARFSPFYPHGGIPVPNTPGRTAQSVEGLWQGLKVFESEDVDPKVLDITTMRGIKRSARSRGGVRGHRFGLDSPALLPYRDARLLIYLPAYRWALDHRLTAEVARLRELAARGTVVLLDYETNDDVNDLSRPLSHAGLLIRYVEGRWPGEV